MYYIIGTVVIITLLIVANITMYNEMLKKENGVKNAYSSLDIELKKRYDLIPNIVTCVKEYMKYEQVLLENITKARADLQQSNSIINYFKMNNDIENNIKKFIIISEGYPNLKTNTNFLKLQAILNDVEEHISAGRRTYNAHVTHYNNFIQMFPNNIFANIFGFKKKELFKISQEEQESRKWINE